MKKSNGFTLVELIAVIALLTILATIAISSVSSIKTKVNERQYKSLATTIELAAERYFSETGVKKMFVQTLIDVGLVSTDDETKQVYDPRNKASLNCKVILVDDNDKALLTEEDSKCNMKLLEDEFIKILPCPNKNNVCNEKDWSKDKWYNNTLYLHPVSTNIADIDLTKDNISFKWITPLAPDDVYKEKVLEVQDETASEIYQLEVIIDGVSYRAEKEIRIDKRAPMVIDAYVTNPSSWSSVKNFSFVLVDELSGVAGYYITNDEANEVSNDKFKKISPISRLEVNINIDLLNDFENYKENDSIYVWTKDAAGNIKKNKVDFKIGNLDLEAVDEGSLKMDFEPKLPKYTQTAKLIGEAIDSKSGLIAYSFSKNKLSKYDVNWLSIPKTNAKFTITDEKLAKRDDTYYFCVKDAVENVDCAYVNVNNTDNEVDEVRIKKNNNNLSVKLYEELSLYAKDNKAGVSHYFVSTSTNVPKENEWIALGTSLKEFSLNYKVYENGTYYLHIKDDAGNIDSSFKNKNNGGNNMVVIDNIDREGPVYQSGGEVRKGRIDNSHWTDKSLPITLLYYVTTGEETPTAQMFKSSSRTFEVAACGEKYTVWAKATDALGNYTIRKMGTYSLPSCCSEGTWTYKECSSSGFEVQTRYNECLSPAQYEYRATNNTCMSPLEYGEWGDCTSLYCSTGYAGIRFRDVTYYVGGVKYDKVESGSCNCGRTSCSNIGFLENKCGMCGVCNSSETVLPWNPPVCMTGVQTRIIYYYHGGGIISRTETKSCTIPSWLPNKPTYPGITIPDITIPEIPKLPEIPKFDFNW